MKRCRWMGLLLLLLPVLALAQPDSVWTHWYGGAMEENGYAVKETADFGLVIAGETRSFGAGGADFYLVRTDSLGDTLWTRRYGGAQDETCYGVQPTMDGGFILAGRTTSFGGNNWGGYLVRTNSGGDTLWTHKYGGAQFDEFEAVLQTPDSGFLAAGYTVSSGAGGGDFWVMKVNSHGDSVWSRTFGGAGAERGYALAASPDGGYVMAGSTQSFGLTTGTNFWLVKFSATGDSLWSRAYGDSSNEVCNAVCALGDAFVLAGYTESHGEGFADYWVVKVSATGDSLGSRTFGTPRQDFCYSVNPTQDGGLMIAGDSDQGSPFGSNFWMVKLNANLDSLWNTGYGGLSIDRCRAAVQTVSGRYVMAGNTYSYGSGIPNFYVVKTQTPVQRVTVSPDSIDFGAVAVGSTVERVVIIRNAGTYPTHVTAVVAPTGFASPFTGDHALPPTGTVQALIRFTPEHAGAYADTVRVISSAPDSPALIRVYGIGIGNATDERGAALPKVFALDAAPNPFNAATTVTFDVPRAGRIQLAIYDVRGRQVAVLYDGMMAAGRCRAPWDGAAVASGVYFVRLDAAGAALTRKVVLLK